VGGPPAISALVSGALDFVNQAPDVNMRPRSKGVDVRMTSNMYAGRWSALMASKLAVLPHIKDGYPAIMQDIVGKKFGGTVLGGTTDAYMRSAFEEAGLNGSSATYVAVGGLATAVPAMEHNVVDAEMLGGAGPELTKAMSAGKILLDYRVKGIGPKSVQALWRPTLGWHARPPANRDKIYAAIGKRMQMPAAVTDPTGILKKIIDVNANLLGIGIPRETIDGWNAYLVSLNQIPAPIPYNDIVWWTGRP
jgi:NMT1/THI5 like